MFNRKHIMLSIYTDGACAGNGHAGARSSYAFFCLETEHGDAGEGSFEGKSTNNTGELMAILKAMKYAKGKTKKLRIYSDSKYAINSISVWTIRPGKKNIRLITECQKMLRCFSDVSFEWIKGHGSSEMNNYVDELATNYLKNNK